MGNLLDVSWHIAFSNNEVEFSSLFKTVFNLDMLLLIVEQVVIIVNPKTLYAKKVDISL